MRRLVDPGAYKGGCFDEPLDLAWLHFLRLGLRFRPRRRAGSAAEPAAAPVAAPDRPATPPEKPAFKSFALELNPLAASLGRYSAQAEWLPAEHHAIVLNPHFDHVSWDGTLGSSTYSESFSGFGAEVGYRYYTGSSGANGFFVGPSLIAATYSTSERGSGTQGGGVSFTSVGAAVDLGGQWIVGPGVVLGFGAGLQYTKASVDSNTDGMSLAAAVISGSGVRPRALFSVGYAF